MIKSQRIDLIYRMPVQLIVGEYRLMFFDIYQRIISGADNTTSRVAIHFAKCIHLLKVYIIKTGTVFQYPVRGCFKIFIGANQVAQKPKPARTTPTTRCRTTS